MLQLGGKNNIEILSPDTISNFPDADIFVATKYEDQIFAQLKSMSIPDDRIYSAKCCLSLKNKNEIQRKRTIELKKISIGMFLKDFYEQYGTISLRDATFNPGGSGVLDYAFIRAVLLKYDLSTYMEIGTYIGESIHSISDITDLSISLTVEPEHPASMRRWCMQRGIPDYSNRLVTDRNIHQYFADSKEFDFGKIKEKIDLYFIDGDHSYEGVVNDTKKVFAHKERDSFVIWHDFCTDEGIIQQDVVAAVNDSLSKKEFEQVFATDNNMCGIYVPDKFLNDFSRYMNYENKILYTYDLNFNVNERMPVSDSHNILGCVHGFR